MGNLLPSFEHAQCETNPCNSKDTKSRIKGYQFCVGISSTQLGGRYLYGSSNWIPSGQANLGQLQLTVPLKIERQPFWFEANIVQLVQQAQTSFD